MQKLHILLFIFGLGSVVQAQTSGVYQDDKDGLAVKETRFDFGKIQQGKPVTHNFELKNTGNEPLQIENVQASCGCTTPEWSHEPIAPGKTKTIKVGYNAAVKGPFEKLITVYYHSGKTKLLYIKGEVWETPVEPAPANASIKFLKSINH